MYWEEYYEKIDEWATSTAVNRLSKLESFGSPEEIVYVIDALAWENEKAATKLLKMATDAGIKFSGEQLTSLSLICEETELIRAIHASCDTFTDSDIEELYGCFDDDLVIEIARKAKRKCPADLQDFYTDQLDTGTPSLEKSYDYILECLFYAHEKIVLALKLSIGDMGSDKKALAIAKHACLNEATPYINDAITTLEEIGLSPEAFLHLSDIQLNLGKMLPISDLYTDNVFTDWLIQRRIRKILQNIEHAIKKIQLLQQQQQ